MTYLNDQTTKIYVPRVMVNGEPTELYMTNLVSKAGYSFPITDLSSGNTYYEFDLTGFTEVLVEGQYYFDILDENNNVLFTGLAQYGDYQPEEPTTHNTNEINYVQYNG